MRLRLAKPILRFLCCLIAFMPLAGCWSKEELNDRAFVTLMTVDRTKDGLTELSLGFFLPNRMTSGQGQAVSREKPFSMVNRTGRDLAEAFHSIQKDLSRKVTWGALRVIIIGESYARSGIQPLLDFMLRMTDIRMNTLMYQIEGKALAVGSLTPIFERFPSEIIREYSHMDLLPGTTIKDLMYARYNHGDAFLPQLFLAPPQKSGDKRETGRWLGTKGSVLMKDSKQTAEFSPAQTRGIQWVTNKVKNMSLTFNAPQNSKPISVRIARSKSSMFVESANDRILVHLHVATAGDLLSIETSSDLSDVQVIRELEQAAANQIKKDIQDVLKQTVSQQADLFHVSDQIEWMYPKLWNRMQEHWRSYYAEHTEFQVEVEMKLQRFGALKQSIVEKE